MGVRALVVGASGYVGSRLVAALVRDGQQVVAAARHPDELASYGFAPGVDRVALDVSDPQSCTDALAAAGPVDVAYYLVHSIGGDDFAERDRQAASHFADAARRSRVRRVVYLGGLVPAGEELSEHLASREDVGEVLTDKLEDADGDTVWLRAAIILGSGSTSFEVLRYMAERLPVVPLPSFMNRAVSPIAVDDVLWYLVAAGDPGKLPAGSYDISTTGTISYADLIRAYARHHGLRRLWLPVPGVPAAVAAPIVAALTPIPRAMVTDLVRSLANDMHSDDHRIREYVPDPPGGLTTVDQAIARATVPDPPRPTVSAAPDPLQLMGTDPEWAGGRRRRHAPSS